MRVTGNAKNTVTINTISVQQAGTTITKDAQEFQKDRENEWTTYSCQTGLVPAMCLRNDFDAFYDQQKPLARKVIENRIKIGQTLAKAASLWDFQETVTAKSFDGPNIYQENPYDSSTSTVEPVHFQQPKNIS